MVNFDGFINFCLIYIEKVSQKNVTRVFIFFVFTYIKHMLSSRNPKTKTGRASHFRLPSLFSIVFSAPAPIPISH